MADVNVPGSTTATHDQSSYPGDTVLNVNYGNSSTLNITNTTGSSDVLEVNQSVQGNAGGTSVTLNLGENAHVLLTGDVTARTGSTFNYNLSDGSSLELDSSFVSSDPSFQVNIDLGSSGASTLIYDTTGADLSQAPTVNLTGISAGDQITVTNAASGEYVDGDLVFKDAQGNTIATFNADDLDPSQINFNGGSMSYACFLRGTHIATPNGEVRVEDLRAGDEVLTASGGVATVKWLGHRMLHKKHIPMKDAIRAFPVLLKKSAIAPGMPHRDLIVSPMHHLYFDGALIPAMLLVNGQTIIQQFDMKEFEYFHVELEKFDILLAEGMPAESYIDMNNRSMFDNAHTVALRPDFEPAKVRPVIDGIEIVRSGPVVEALRKRLMQRAQKMTQNVRIKDPALRVEVNGQEILAENPAQSEGVMRFALPAGAALGDLHIHSRSAVVRDISLSPRRDLRQVGVGLARITIEDEAGRRDIDLLAHSLNGMHAVQDVHGIAMRWTGGHAVIPASLHAARGQAVLELHVMRTYSYWEKQQRAA
ncbi:Hint domain-containing protein [Bordetella genomosp. 4]|uniref:Hedgehog/Intein (Hint) domain-containing protein n=1 Tax=Bordetella genomosp. 4 TaxID=463044 RepID=A0A261UBL7_9BORD|nr:Hint domain-containing protein [Bordetella genomosp. 4]OZI52695.1 hypothetical protein CAL21_03465 [Bordetella genomosp. 4]OZI59309.1 hypothetical protein CAL20_05835 [Bordetella genomosp. 4]